MSAAAIAVVVTAFLRYFTPITLSGYFRDVLHFPCDTSDQNCDNMSTFLPSYAVLFLELGIVTGILFIAVIVITPAVNRARLAKDFRLTSAILMTLFALPVPGNSPLVDGPLAAILVLLSFALYVAAIIALFASVRNRSLRFDLLAASAAVLALLLSVAAGTLVFVVAGTIIAYPVAAVIASLLAAPQPTVITKPATAE